MTPKQRGIIIAKLAADPDNDCVAVFRKEGGLAFHIPDRFIAGLTAGTKIPSRAKLFIAFVQLLTEIISDNPEFAGVTERLFDRFIASLDL